MLHDTQIHTLLTDAHTIAVVGMSDKPERDSYGVAEFLQKKGYRIIPVNPLLQGRELLGEAVYASLRDIPEHIDIVDIFRRPDAVPEIIEDAVAIGADAVWMQLGVINEAAAQQAEEAGLQVVMDRCIAVERRRMDMLRQVT